MLSAAGVPFCSVAPLEVVAVVSVGAISEAVYAGVCRDHGNTQVWFGNEVLRKGYIVVHWVKSWVLTKQTNHCKCPV